MPRARPTARIDYELTAKAYEALGVPPGTKPTRSLPRTWHPTQARSAAYHLTAKAHAALNEPPAHQKKHTSTR